jgi:hypothetical protein
MGKWGFTYVLCAAFVSHASSISKRFSDQKAMHQPAPKLRSSLLKGAEHVKEFWGIGKKDTGSWLLDAGSWILVKRGGAT